MHYENAFIKLQKHSVELSDAWWGFGKEKTFEFYDIGKSSISRVVPDLENNAHNLFEIAFEIEQNQILHTRQVYTMVGFMGDAGGLLQVLVFFPGILLFPISLHKMLMAASKELYVVSKEDAQILSEKLDEKHNERCHYTVSYSALTSIQIFLMSQFDCFKYCIKNAEKKRRIINKTQQIIEEYSDILAVIKNMR